jgi:hypothetical protein
LEARIRSGLESEKESLKGLMSAYWGQLGWQSHWGKRWLLV